MALKLMRCVLSFLVFVSLFNQHESMYTWGYPFSWFYERPPMIPYFSICPYLPHFVQRYYEHYCLPDPTYDYLPIFEYTSKSSVPTNVPFSTPTTASTEPTGPTPDDYSLYKDQQPFEPIDPGYDDTAKTTTKKPRVVGGQNATEGQFPYQISLKTYRNTHNCGGCLINNEWILTASHCIGSSSSSVYLGSIDINVGGIKRGIKKSIKHPQYTPATKLNDIALIRLDSPVQFDDKIKPLQLPTEDIPVGVTMDLTGYGLLTYPVTSMPTILQFLPVRIIENSECQQQWTSTTIHPGNVCSTSPKGQGVCKGDSGGPLAYNGVIHGIVSYGASCALGYPDVYTRVRSYVDWINNTIAEADLINDDPKEPKDPKDPKGPKGPLNPYEPNVAV